MTLSPGDIVALGGLTEQTMPVGSDLAPILRNAPMQFAKLSTLQGFVVNSAKYYGAMGDGVTDDTGAIQSAINAGQPFFFPPGVYRTSATLNFNQAVSHGQVARGAGSTASEGTGPDKAIIRPEAQVTCAISIDGAPFGGWVQGCGLEDLTIDMSNMADTAASVAILHGQAFDGRFTNVRVIGDGLAKRGWKFLAGAYVTSLRACQCANVEFAGQEPTDRATTITLDACDIRGLTATWALNITFTGGTIQGPYNAGSVIWLAPGSVPTATRPIRAGSTSAPTSPSIPPCTPPSWERTSRTAAAIRPPSTTGSTGRRR